MVLEFFRFRDRMGGPTVELMTVPVPLSYREIADDITDRIRSGEYPPGERIPSYSQLAEIYSVSVSTAQRGVGLLQDRRLVVGAQGRGLFVADDALGRLGQ